jgi:hypothetical protein
MSKNITLIVNNEIQMRTNYFKLFLQKPLYKMKIKSFSKKILLKI